jgi:hypothetical protein
MVHQPRTGLVTERVAHQPQHTVAEICSLPAAGCATSAKIRADVQTSPRTTQANETQGGLLRKAPPPRQVYIDPASAPG